MTRVFFCEELPRVRRYLRRYASREDRRCTAAGRFYCNAMAPFDEVEAEPRVTIKAHDEADAPPPNDPRWPQFCDACALPFDQDDPRQVFNERLYRRLDTGAETEWEAAGVGAVRDCWWISDRPAYTGADGRSLEVRLPDGTTWMIDSRCSNCTKPDDNTHKCWVRHGRPEDGSLHVDKNGDTCSAGAGSIQTKQWHGWLHNGALTQC